MYALGNDTEHFNGICLRINKGKKTWHRRKEHGRQKEKREFTCL